jgi:sporulation protein YlmC with PRC-barrel domain
MTFAFGTPSNKNDRHFIFDVSKNQLDNAPGFDSSHWPNVADPKWSASIDKHYKVERKAETAATDAAHSTARVERTDKPRTEDTVPNARVTDAPNLAVQTVFRASKVKGIDVRNDANENLGDVNELVIDAKNGHLRYLALSFGSIFTGGNKLFAVPLSAVTLSHAENKTFLTLHVSQDNLRNAPGFDKNNWPNTADPNWARDIDSFYQRTATRSLSR